jgi:hypothetical protein
MTGRKVLLGGSVALLVLLLTLGCSLLARDDGAAPEAGGWYIRLQVQAPGSKGITVTDFNVTGLNIQVRDPAGEVLQSIDWLVAEGAQTYTVPVKQVGEHQIEVTHFGEHDGEQAQATESAAFSIQAMKITVIDIVPGGIGLMRVVGQEVPPPIDLTGYWDDTSTWADGSVERSLVCMLQTGSTVNMANGMTLTLHGLTFSEELWVPDFESYITVAGTISADGSEISGTQSGFPFGGGSAAFHMVRSTFSFGRLDLEGSCAGQPVSLHTDYGYARRSETISTYSHEISLNWSGFWGSLQLTSNGALSVGTYPVTDRWPEPVGEIRASIFGPDMGREASGGSIEFYRYDGAGMAGSFSLDFPEGTLTGSFDVTYGANSGYITVTGWLSGTTANPHALMSVRTHTLFEIDYLDQDLNARLWCDINGELRTGTFNVPNDVSIDFSWSSDSGSHIEGWSSWDMPGTMSISGLSESNISGNFAFNFEQGGSLSGSLDLSFLQ